MGDPALMAASMGLPAFPGMPGFTGGAKAWANRGPSGQGGPKAQGAFLVGVRLLRWMCGFVAYV